MIKPVRRELCDAISHGDVLAHRTMKGDTWNAIADRRMRPLKRPRRYYGFLARRKVPEVR